ncbi:hypothetical protein TRVA0_013S02168 [Trichomonascus vanleenenianus]|uniref:uncharacterized protein n=1 Tax=Trichomonascus vanleenenianus TaxID=2268995 RepID=UPI003EC9CEC9
MTHLILIPLADEYLQAAQTSPSPNERIKYVSLAIASLKAALDDKEISTETRLAVHYRLARILFEETEHTAHAEEAVSTGVREASAAYLHEWKIRLEQLGIEFMVSNGNVAMKPLLTQLDSCLESAQILQKSDLLYSLILQKIHLLWSNSSSEPDKCLSLIQSLEPNQSVALSHLAYLMEADKQLDLCNYERVDFCLSKLTMMNNCPPQFSIIKLFLQTRSALQQNDAKIINQLKSQLQQLTVDVLNNALLPDGRIRLVLLDHTTLVFQWLPSEDAYITSLFLSGLCDLASQLQLPLQQTTHSSWFSNALKRIESPHTAPETTAKFRLAQKARRDELKRVLLAFDVLANFIRNRYMETLPSLKQLPSSDPFIVYLWGCVYQATGSTRKAVEMYKRVRSEFMSAHELYLLASLNLLLLSQNTPLFDELMAELEGLIPKSPQNAKLIGTALNLLKTTFSIDDMSDVDAHNALAPLISSFNKVQSTQLKCIISAVSLPWMSVGGGASSGEANNSNSQLEIAFSSIMKNGRACGSYLWLYTGAIVRRQVYEKYASRSSNEYFSLRSKQHDAMISKLEPYTTKNINMKI